MTWDPRYIQWFNWDKKYQRAEEIIKKDPYRYVLSKKEESKAYHRIKRALFVFGLPSLYIYKHLRYHNELGAVRNFRITSIQLLQIVPRLLLSVVILYPLSCSFFIDYDKLRSHQIAELELKKFDRDWFTFNDYKYALLNAPAYVSDDSQWGRIYTKRLPFNYDQQAGWIKRLKDRNPNIDGEVPPKYDSTPDGDRKYYRFSEEGRNGDVRNIIQKAEYN